jgi:hypothetical protein
MNKIAENVYRCYQTHELTRTASCIQVHEMEVEQFTQAAKECPRRAETGGCDDNRNAYHYCRWWACPLTKED